MHGSAELAPLRLLFAIGAGLALHWLHRRLQVRLGPVLAALQRLGQRSLRVYLAHGAAVVAVTVVAVTAGRTRVP